MWADYRKRNDSVVVDRCTGQYKSQLTCPQCKRVSVTFDPFQYITLSLPSTKTRTITVTVVRPDRPIGRLALTLPYRTQPRHWAVADYRERPRGGGARGGARGGEREGGGEEGGDVETLRAMLRPLRSDLCRAFRMRRLFAPASVGAARGAHWSLALDGYARATPPIIGV